MKLIMEFSIRMLFSMYAIIALVPTQILRIISQDSKCSLGTKTKIIDFILGLILVIAISIGLFESAEIVISAMMGNEMDIIAQILCVIALILFSIFSGIIITTFQMSFRDIRKALW